MAVELGKSGRADGRRKPKAVRNQARTQVRLHGFERGTRTFDAFMVWSLAALHLCWGAYMILMPVEVLRKSPQWAGAMAVTPGHNLAWLGLVLVFAALFLAASRAERRLYLLALPGHVIGCATWAMIGGSFAYAAAVSQGLGAANVAVSAFIAAIHAALIWQRRL